MVFFNLPKQNSDLRHIYFCTCNAFNCTGITVCRLHVKFNMAKMMRYVYVGFTCTRETLMPFFEKCDLGIKP